MSVHRLRRPIRLRKWPKVLGVALLLCWVAFLAVPSGAERSVEVLVAKRNIFAGERVDSADFQTNAVILGEASQTYVSAGNFPLGATAARDVFAGELLTKTSIGLSTTALTPLALQLNQALPSQIRAGCSVNVWATAIRLGQVEGVPELVVIDARVSSIKSAANMGQERVVVEVMVEQEFVPKLLLAQADGSIISLVLNPTLADE